MSKAVRVPASAPGEIAEFQGLYGAFNVSEVLLQKIWLRQQFAVHAARTIDGQRVVVRSPGRWNRLSGPDFRGARLEIGAHEMRGAVELHFHAEAWLQHGHDRDPAYDEVVLHVVLFPPASLATPARTSKGREIPTLVLIDLLWHDLEEYAEDEAVAALSGRDPMPLLEQLLALPESARAERLRDSAIRRWKEKTHFAKLRIARLGWEEASHQTALEVLGYRYNRAPMLHVATRFPWKKWRSGGEPSVSQAFDAAAEFWTTRGVRPANHPRHRLEQYASLMQRDARWPVAMREWPLPGAETISDPPPESFNRRRLGTRAVRHAIASRLFRASIAGSRLDTLVVDLVLPFLGAGGQAESAFAYWSAWYPGDMPDGVKGAARQLLSPGTSRVLANGFLQAILGLLLDASRREEENVRDRAGKSRQGPTG